MNTITRIKPGYKQTAVGVIPKDWEVKEMKKMGSFHRGKGISKADLVEDGLRAIRYGEIYTLHHYFVKTIYSFINEETANNSFLLNNGDILFAGSGETLEEIGKSVAFTGDEEVYAGGDIVVLRPIGNSFNSKFLGFITNNEVFRRQTYRVGQGNSVVHIYPSNLKKIQLPIPPLSEQKAIADCLTTWDRGIEKLSALIQSKKEQKKGLMQQLLTGTLRLRSASGERFTEEWKYRRINEVAKIIGGGTPSTTIPNYWDGEINWFTPTEIKNKFVTESIRKITKEGLKNSSAKLLPPGTILLTTRATIGEASIAKIECSTNQGFQSIICTPGKANTLFFYDLVRFNRREFLRKANGSTFLEISKNEIDKIQFKIPSYQEQTAIAKVLTSADKEIELLEKKLETFKTQKKGLMQVLMTGEKRIIDG